MKHMKKRVAALLLTLAMVLSLAPMAFAADEFPDMPAEDDPSYAAVKSAVDNAIMTGENGELNLEGTILRSTVAKMVVTAFAAKGEADLSGYPDVNSEAWYASWMAKANQMGIMTGSSGKMNPGSEVTLAEVAAMLVRALGLPVDKDATVDGVAAWAAPYIKALLDAGLIDDAADAGKPMTRGAFAEVIFRVSGGGNYAKEENAEITEDVNGNIVITANGVSLKGITVKGDIIIADGVDAGSVVLDGVKVEGRIVVRGAGAELTNGTTAGATVVAATTGETTVKADASSSTGDIAVAGTNGMAADKVVLDMAEPNATVTAATEVAVQNAKGGEITLQAPNASLSVESGTVANVTVADGASGVKVDVAEGATIDKVTTNTDLAITGEGAVNEKAGSGTVTDGSGAVVDGSDEPVDVPTVEEPAVPVEELPEELQKADHTHNFITETTNGVNAVVAPFDATRHTIKCVANNTNISADNYDAGCDTVIYEAHNFEAVKDEQNNITGYACSVCDFAQPGSVTDEGEDLTEPTTKPANWQKCADDAHDWKPTAANVEGNVAATCANGGAKVMECSICHCTRVDTTAPLGHNVVTTGTDAATCNAPGAQHFACTRCDADIDDVEIPATGDHKWTLKTENKGTDCQTHGNNVYMCSVCKTPKTVNGSGPVGNHDFSDGYTASGTTHTATCKTANCGATDVINGHHLVADSERAAVAVTCTTDGKTAGHKCDIGDCTYKDTQTTIPATGHTFDKGWTVANEGHWHKCTACTAFNTASAAETAKAQTGFVKHEGATANECKACGWVKPHTHNWVKNASSGVVSCQPADGSECPTNATCSHSSWNKTGDHKCATCGLVTHEHTKDDWNQTTECTVCGATHAHAYTSTGSNGTVGKCTTCDSPCPGDHSKTEGEKCAQCGGYGVTASPD